MTQYFLRELYSYCTVLYPTVDLALVRVPKIYLVNYKTKTTKITLSDAAALKKRYNGYCISTRYYKYGKQYGSKKYPKKKWIFYIIPSYPRTVQYTVYTYSTSVLYSEDTTLKILLQYAARDKDPQAGRAADAAGAAGIARSCLPGPADSHPRCIHDGGALILGRELWRLYSAR